MTRHIKLSGKVDFSRNSSLEEYEYDCLRFIQSDNDSLFQKSFIMFTEIQTQPNVSTVEVLQPVNWIVWWSFWSYATFCECYEVNREIYEQEIQQFSGIFKMTDTIQCTTDKNHGVCTNQAARDVQRVHFYLYRKISHWMDKDKKKYITESKRTCLYLTIFTSLSACISVGKRYTVTIPLPREF